MALPVLDLSTFIDRPEVKLDGQKYQLYNRDELSVIDVAILDRWMKEMERLESIGDAATETDAEMYLDIARKYVGKVAIGMPAEVLAKLSITNLRAIVIHFYGLPQSVPAAGAATTTKAHQSRKSTGGRSRRG